MKRKSAGIIMSIALAGSLALAGCTGQPLSTREEGTLGGTAVGAGGIGRGGRRPSSRGCVDRRCSGRWYWLRSRQFDAEYAGRQRPDPAAGAVATAGNRESARADPTAQVAVGNRIKPTARPDEQKSGATPGVALFVFFHDLIQSGLQSLHALSPSCRACPESA
jgi:hypothetical protein